MLTLWYLGKVQMKTNRELSNVSGTPELKMQVEESLELKPQEWITSLKASV